jgi:hypothetical protein
MRTNGTKYDEIDQLPKGALPVSRYAKKHKISSPAYVHVKYDRFKFGYVNKQGNFVHGEDPGYEIRDYEGTNYVIEP